MECKCGYEEGENADNCSYCRIFAEGCSIGDLNSIY